MDNVFESFERFLESLAFFENLRETGILEKLCSYEVTESVPILCMLVEEVARAHDEDVRELMKTMYETSKDVYEMCGKYE